MSEYPIILSLEVHCGISQQDQMADILIEVLGDAVQFLFSFFPFSFFFLSFFFFVQIRNSTTKVSFFFFAAL